jgi:hypothetical protein
MPRLVGAASEKLADHFVNYLFEEFQGVRHVRRVASWVGLIVLGIEKLSSGKWRIPRDRQLRFEYKGQSFKAKYNHATGPRGGIDIVEILPGRGSPEGRTVVSISSLAEAEQFYRKPKANFH